MSVVLKLHIDVALEPWSKDQVLPWLKCLFF